MNCNFEILKKNIFATPSAFLRTMAGGVHLLGIHNAAQLHQLADKLEGTVGGVDARLHEPWVDAILDVKEAQGQDVNRIIHAPESVQQIELGYLHTHMMVNSEQLIAQGMERFDAQSRVITGMQKYAQDLKSLRRPPSIGLC